MVSRTSGPTASASRLRGALEDFIAAWLRGEAPPWSFVDEPEAVKEVLARGRYHGILALLDARRRAEPEGAADWPEPLAGACRDAALGQTMWELRHQARLMEVMSRLGALGVVPILFKGTALAYTLYPDGAFRTRGDTDLLVPRGAEARLWPLLEQLGYRRSVGLAGEGVGYEACWSRREADGSSHALDVHWRLCNAEVLADLVTYDELLSRAVPIPALGPTARAASHLDALLIACVHRARHVLSPYHVDGEAHLGGDRMIWLYDFHLLASSFSEERWSEFVVAARHKGMSGVCLEGLEQARARFGTILPDEVVTQLGSAAASEPLTRYFASGQLRQHWANFVAIHGMQARARFLSVAFFPPEEHMRAKFPQGGWLPWLYLRRAVAGFYRLVAPARPSMR